MTLPVRVHLSQADVRALRARGVRLHVGPATATPTMARLLRCLREIRRLRAARRTL